VQDEKGEESLDVVMVEAASEVPYACILHSNAAARHTVIDVLARS
jgi:hypothetical protein